MFGNKKGLFLICMFMMLGLLCLSKGVFAYVGHDILPYKVFHINEYRAPLLLLSSKINLKNDSIIIEYIPYSGVTNILWINIAEISNDFTEVRLLGTFELKSTPLAIKERIKTIEYSGLNLRKGINLVLWVSEIETSSFEQKDILKQVNAIRMEQERLSCIDTFKGKEQLIIETNLNIEP